MNMLMSSIKLVEIIGKTPELLPGSSTDQARHCHPTQYKKLGEEKT